MMLQANTIRTCTSRQDRINADVNIRRKDLLLKYFISLLFYLRVARRKSLLYCEFE